MKRIVFGLAIVAFGTHAAVAQDPRTLHARFMDASIRHDLATLRRMIAPDAVWKLGPAVYEGRDEFLKPHAWDAGTGTRLEYRVVRVAPDTVEYELFERNRILDAVGIEVLHAYPRMVFRDGKVVLKEAWRPNSPTPAEHAARMAPLRTWILEAHPEALDVLRNDEGQFEYSREGGALMVELANEWVAAGRPGAPLSGSFAPAGPPVEPPVRVDAGGACIVDLRQPYTIAGSLSGSMAMDYRILVHGSCEGPPRPGQYAEEWVAHGTFDGVLVGREAAATLTYTARVEKGGEVTGRMVFGGGLSGELAVGGSFADGRLAYTGGVLETTAGSVDTTAIGSVERLIVEKMERERIPGLSVSLVVDGEIAWSRGFGFADLENRIPATISTVYRTASIGKPMTATAVMQLVEAGRLDLDVPVQRYCPVFPEKRWPVTTRHLLGHTSGIRHYGGPRNDEEINNTVHYEDVVTPLDLFKDDPLQFEPGTQYGYSTFGYNVLGCVIQGASGEDYLATMSAHVFRPAGMTATRDDDPAAVIPGRARGYVLDVSGRVANAPSVDMSSKLPAGGFVTTADDLARFAAAVMDHRLVSAQTLERMLTPVRLADGSVVAYGLGWGLYPGETWFGEREAFHGGSTPGFSGMLYLLPDARFAVAILTNLENVPDRTALAAEIAKIVLHLGDG